MGTIAELARTGRKSLFPGQGDGRRLWDRAFGVIKEEPRPRPPVSRGSGWTSSAASGANAQMRLIEALRSKAPGGWTADRYSQSVAFTGVQYIAIHRAGEQLQQAEFNVYRRDRSKPDGKAEVTPDDPPEGDRVVSPYDLVRLLEVPNGEDGFGDLLYRWNQQIDLTGSALTWMLPSMAGAPMELYCIPTATAIPQPVINPEYPQGYYRIQPLYPYGPFSPYPSPNSSVGAAIPSQWMLAMRYQHPLLRYEGYAPLTAIQQQIDEINMMDKSRTNSMLRSVRPSAVLNFPGLDQPGPIPEEEIERIRADFMNANQSPENHGQLMIASPGSELAPWSGGSPVDMDYQGGWEQMLSFILAAFGITKPAAGMIEDASYSTLYATMKQLYWQTLEPKCSRFGRVLTRQLAPFFGDNLIVEIRCRPINDPELIEKKISTLSGAKAITKRRVLELLEEPIPDDAPWLDDIAGDPSPYEKEKEEKQSQQGGPGGVPGAPAPGEEGAEKPGGGLTDAFGGGLTDAFGGGSGGGEEPKKMEAANADMESANEGMQGADGKPLDSERGSDPAVEKARPRPGKLGAGALGPRMKRLQILNRHGVLTASQRNELAMLGLNGNGKH